MASGVDIYTQTCTNPHENDFKKPGACQPAASMHLVYHHESYKWLPDRKFWQASYKPLTEHTKCDFTGTPC